MLWLLISLEEALRLAGESKKSAPVWLMSISIKGLLKQFGATVAVSSLSLDIAEGEMRVLLGPSGCGKTTTMRCIAGLDTPTSGEISIGGRPVFSASSGINVPINQRRVGMVFQSYAIWPHLTVFQNVSFPLEMEGLSRAEIKQRVEDMLALVGLGNFGSRGASYLSGGQMQRVALARSLVMKPSVLLFDEPLSNLDARLRDHLRIELRELQTQFNITGVYVTHDQREALAVADRITVMQAGEMLQTGAPIEIYEQPRTSRIAEFLGYTNIFDVESGVTCSVGTKVRLRDGNELLIRNAEARQDASVCVRPDDVLIRMRDGADVTAQPNCLAGTVTLASFMGTHMQYRVRTESGAVWEAVSPRISSDIRVGSEVVVEISADVILLLSNGE